MLNVDKHIIGVETCDISMHEVFVALLNQLQITNPDLIEDEPSVRILESAFETLAVMADRKLHQEFSCTKS
jgi:hypothetical protein